MKLSLLQENFNTALTTVSRFVSAKSQLPILSNILLSTDNGRLKLSATNLELGINYWVGAKIDTEGSFTLPSKEITEFVSYLSPGRLDLDLNEKSLFSVSSTKVESTFATASAVDYPQLPSINTSNYFEIDSSLLIDTISQIAFSAATDDSRPVLTAIMCQFTPDHILFVATDGFRLSLKQLKLVNPLNLNGKDALTFLIPARSLTEVSKLAKKGKLIKIGLSEDEHQLIFVLDDLELVSRLIEGEYPDYQRIIPESYTTKIYLNRSEFNQAVKIASVFARESANVVKFSVKSNSLELSTNAPQIGQNKAGVDAKVEGDPLEIAFNYKFLVDFIGICHGDNIVIELNQSLSPGFFHDESLPDFTHIIMPVRLQD